MSDKRPRPRKTKVVATVGPACDSEDMLGRMIDAGLNVARLNLSHGTLEEHRARVERIRSASEKSGASVAIMVDTRGIEIRTGPVEGSGVKLVRDAPFALFTEPRMGDASGVSVSYPGLVFDVEPGTRVLLDDGALELEVLATEAGRIDCRVERGGVLRSRKGVNVPDVELTLRPSRPEHRDDLLFAVEVDADYVAASFVQHPDDVLEIRRFLIEQGRDIPIIAKIESKGGLLHLDDIVDVANGTMVARGDLGVELSMAEVPVAQKRIIRTTVSNGKPVITATQMLDSMERNARPTRAEVSDVANAILDGSSAVMLSGETAIGLYPVEAVRTMASLALRAEASLHEYGYLQKILPSPANVVTEAVSQAAITMANALGAAAIIALTESGFTARMISKYRPECPILAVTPEEQVVRKLSMNWGVIALRCAEHMVDDEARVAFAVDFGRERGIIQEGDVVLATAGRSRESGGTDLIRVVTMVGREKRDGSDPR